MYSFAIQRIVDIQQNLIGFEYLLRESSAQSAEDKTLALLNKVKNRGHLIQILDQALNTIVSRSSDPDVHHAINLGPEQLLSQETYSLIRRFHFDHPEIKLMLEISEHCDTSQHHVRKALKRYAELGLTLALDDFGIARANFDMAMAIPNLAIVKLDKSLLSLLDKPSALAHLVLTFQNMGMKVIVEGVESHHQYLLLKSLFADQDLWFQGYFFHEPELYLSAVS